MSSAQIVEQVSAVIIPAMKKKVRKTIKPQPLKGAFIDADLQEEIIQEELIISKVVGEVIAEMVSRVIDDIPVVVAEVVVSPVASVSSVSDSDDDDEEKTMIEINKLKEKLKKQKEEKRRAETATEWTKTEEKYITNIKTNIVPYKALLLEGIKQRKADIIDDMRIYTERFNEQMEKLKNSAENRQMEYDCLEALDNDEAIECILTDKNLKEECYGYAREELGIQVVVAPVIKKAVKASSSSSSKKEKAKYDRVAHWASIPDNKELIIKYKEASAVIIKRNGKPEYMGVQYETINSAGKVFYASQGRKNKAFNAWNDFKTEYNGKLVVLEEYVKHL